MKNLITLTILTILAVHGYSQEFFQDISKQRVKDNSHIVPADYRTIQINYDQLNEILSQAPKEATIAAKNSSSIISIPMADGKNQRFSIVEFDMMEKELQDKYPDIKTYHGQGIDDPTAVIYFDVTYQGFHAMIMGKYGTTYIDPFYLGEKEICISYTKDDFYATNSKTFDEIGVLTPNQDDLGKQVKVQKSKQEAIKDKMQVKSQTPTGSQLRSYRLAIAATGEYTVFHGGTVAAGLSAIVTSMVRVNGVYETEVDIRMVLVGNNDLVVYTNGGTDPYNNGNGGAMLGENQANLDAVIGTANYDVGHVYSTGGGGIASLQSPCTSNRKAQGVTGQPTPIGDPFDIDYVCHEFGHQWGGNHTQNNTCQRSTNAAFEPGSASTIMGYAGICPVNLQSNSDAYFHNHSFNEIISYSQSGFGNTCATITNTGNGVPTVNANNGQSGVTIPVSTPFELTATGNDPDGDPLTYNWEQYDLGPSTGSTAQFNNPTGNQPIFRSWTATSSPTRVFPRLQDLVNNTTVVGELLPTNTRGLTFRCTVRDNRTGGGGVNDSQMSINVSDVGGPFIVQGPNGGETLTGNTSVTVTWDVANTTASPINCNLVDIFLSTDGGFTYPTTILVGTPNDGSQTINLPNIPTSQARIKVKGNGNVFFDISNGNFTIENGIAGPGCDDPTACNFDPLATSNNGTCTYPGCTTSSACNYDPTAGCDDGSCVTGGCTDPTACNFDAAASCDNGNCIFGAPNDVCANAIPLSIGVNTIDNTNTCLNGGYSIPGGNCNGTNAWCNTGLENDVFYSFTTPNGPTVITLETSFDGTGTLTDTQMAVFEGCTGPLVGANDDGGADLYMSRLEFDCTDLTPNTTYYVLIDGWNGDEGTANLTMTFDGSTCGTPGCTDPTACNFDNGATSDDGSCLQLDCAGVCGGSATTDNCGVCNGDNNTCTGCTDNSACNYDASATIDDGSCLQLDECGVCGGSSTAGCTDPGACNYDASADCSDGSCEFISCSGCTDVNACNYDSSATIDNGSCVSPTTYYFDSDSDGYGNPEISIDSCTPPNNFVTNSDDCDDTNQMINPDATEICDGVDNNCDGSVDENIATTTYYEDLDGDGFGSANSIESCLPVGDFDVTVTGDCDDSNANIYPGSAEICGNGMDDNCNGSTDENQTTYYVDNDLDGFGDPNNSIQACGESAGIVSDNTDCDDSNGNIYPGAPGTAEDLDNNCDGQITGDEIAPCLADFNLDGFITIDDLLFILGDFGCTENCTADITNDGAVNVSDVSLFLGLFGTACD